MFGFKKKIEFKSTTFICNSMQLQQNEKFCVVKVWLKPEAEWCEDSARLKVQTIIRKKLDWQLGAAGETPMGTTSLIVMWYIINRLRCKTGPSLRNDIPW